MSEQWLYHNSHDIYYRSPFGAVEEGTPITLRLRAQPKDEVFSAVLRLWVDNKEELIPMSVVQTDGPVAVYETRYVAPWKTGIVWYYFMAQTKEGLLYYCNNSGQWGGVGQIAPEPKNSYQITVYKKGYQTPGWIKDSIIYQIFVDRFYRGRTAGREKLIREGMVLHDQWEELPYYEPHPNYSGIKCNDFFGGNLEGIIEKLPYLKDLGVGAIYLNPIFEAPSNHKYDTADYKKIDPMFGDEQTFQELCRKAGKVGIRVILDGVFSHTGSDSVYFNKYGRYPELGAYQSKESPYYQWFKFTKFPEEYDCWWGIDTLPNVDEMNPSYMDYIIESEDSVIRHWLRLGSKGWRLDVVDELPDPFLKEIRRIAKSEDSDAVVIGEVWEDASNKFSYGKTREFLWGEELDSAMNYPFRNAVLSFLLGQSVVPGTSDREYTAETFHRSLMALYENYPRAAFYSMMNLIGSHDVTRALTLLQDSPPENALTKEEQSGYSAAPEKIRLGKERMKLAMLIQMTFPGVPSIYYGDEAGLEGYRDPFNRRPYPWGNEDLSLLDCCKELAAIRNRYDVLRTGSWHPVYHYRDVYGYVRSIDNGKDIFDRPRRNNLALVLVNRSPDTGYTVSVELRRWNCSRLFDLRFGKGWLPLNDGILNMHLSPLEGQLLVKEVET